MDITQFNSKLNKLDGNIYTIEEVINPIAGVYEKELAHDNVEVNTINIYTGSKLTGTKINTYTTSTPSLTPWKTIIKIFSTEPVLYITYETTGDTVEAEDVNNLQDALNETQIALNSEIDRAVKKEKQIETALDTEINRAKKAENDEATRATNAEKVLSDNLNKEILRANNAENTIINNLNIEVDRAKDAESTLATKIDAEKTRAISAENTINNALDTEVDRAKSAESILATNLNTEINRATAEEQSIKSDINSNRSNWNDAYSKRHIHNNKSIIDSLGKSSEGDLTFEGCKIVSTTVNGLADNITIEGGNNITITKEGNKIIVAGNGSQDKIVTNTPISINALDWTLDNTETPNMYKVTINHNLNDSNIIVSIYNGLQVAELTGVRIIDNNSIELRNYEAIDCRVIINSSGKPTEVIDNLESSESLKALSAKQGKILKGMIDDVEGGITVGTTVLNSIPTNLFFKVLN